MTKDKTEKLSKGKIIRRALTGRMTLELYNKQAIVAFRGKREIFWVDFDQLNEIIKDFSLTIETMRKKPNLEKTTSDKKSKG